MKWIKGISKLNQVIDLIVIEENRFHIFGKLCHELSTDYDRIHMDQQKHCRSFQARSLLSSSLARMLPMVR
jgi:hypothetical protein